MEEKEVHSFSQPGLFSLSNSLGESFNSHIDILLLAQEILPSWDRQVQNLCFQVNNVIEKIETYAPEWVAKYTESQMSS